MKKISILGSTGSMGRQTLQVVESLRGRFEVAAVAAGNNLEEVAGQVVRHRPRLVSVATEEKAAELKERLGAEGIQARLGGGSAPGVSGTRMMEKEKEEKQIPRRSDSQGESELLGMTHAPSENPKRGGEVEIVWGREGMLRVAMCEDAEIVVSAAVGVVGLEATYAAVEAGKRVALANKEVLVAAGEVVMAAAKRKGTELLPVDSEHNAIHQCLRAGERKEVKRLILTASGGPFRLKKKEELENVTPAEALAHPNWKMGPRITIDSATLMNKGFEVIEAHWLFEMKAEQIAVVIHPQSTVHSMVEFVDGSIVAQLGATDMRMPIQYALTYPERAPSQECSFDWTTLNKLEFEKSSPDRFPCLVLAREAMRQGGAQPCALNAADEIAVAAFLEGRLAFTGIAEVIERVMKRMPKVRLKGIPDVLEADGEARRLAGEEVKRAAKGRSTVV